MENALHKELKKYKKKYYLNLLLKGTLVATALLLFAFISISALEYLGRFGTTTRAVLFFTFLFAGIASLAFWVVVPILHLLQINRQLSDEEAAQQIGRFFPEVDDKLINTLQLSQMSASDNALVRASIAKKTKELTVVKFTDAVQLSENRKYAKYILVPLALLLAIFFISPEFFKEFFTKSSARIINYDDEFAEPAPFEFELQNKKLRGFKNEDFEVKLKLDGRAIPTEVYLMSAGRKYKMAKQNDGSFTYNFPKLQKGVDFYFDAAGFSSQNYDITLIERPSLLSFSANLNYPAYLGKASEKWDNIGNLVVPEGTQIQWRFKVNQSDELKLIFNKGKDTISTKKLAGNTFTYNKQARTSQGYQVRLKNKYSYNKEAIKYFINVVPDRYPKISLQEYQDTATYNFLSVGGSVSDDYGLSALKLFYRVNRKGKTRKYRTVNIPISGKQSIQNYYYQLNLLELSLQPGDRVEYYAQVWDNDGVNGAKSSRSSMQQFKLPDESELREEIDKSVEEAEKQIDKTLQKARKLQKDVDKIQQKLREKNNVDYQDKKALENVLKERKELIKDIKKLQSQNEKLNEKQERFDENSEKIAEKMEQLQKLMDSLLDEETKKLYEELEKLLEKNKNNDAVLEKLENIDQKEKSLEKELERALEMFKQMQFEQKLEQTTKDLEELGKEQEKLGEETENKEISKEKAIEEQKEISEKFEDLKKEMQKLEEMDENLEEKNGMEEMNEKMENQEQEISEKQEKSIEQLQKNQKKKAGENQKDAGKKMQEMSKQMQNMMQSMDMEMMQENIDDLRDILENLVQLSFDQEQLKKDLVGINLSDPKFIELAQKQVKLQDDARIIEDSLTALSKRVFQIESFVTRELGNMKQYMDESTNKIKERRLAHARSKQQLAMTSMNNLALMLSDVLQQMQNAMQNASRKPSKGKGKPQKGKTPSLSQLQKQLNQQIQQLKKSGKSGRQLSEQLAKLAAEQARLRRALEELEKKGLQSGQGTKEEREKLSKELKEIKKEMEKTEEDLVFKRLERISIERQKSIETRLLESEKAMRERGEKEERKSKTGKNRPKNIPPSLEQYFKNKEKQLELLKTVPPSLSPYYKKEVDEYFEKLEK